MAAAVRAEGMHPRKYANAGHARVHNNPMKLLRGDTHESVCLLLPLSCRTQVLRQLLFRRLLWHKEARR
jgi:hypothetical protein